MTYDGILCQNMHPVFQHVDGSVLEGASSLLCFKTVVFSALDYKRCIDLLMFAVSVCSRTDTRCLFIIFPSFSETRAAYGITRVLLFFCSPPAVVVFLPDRVSVLAPSQASLLLASSNILNNCSAGDALREKQKGKSLFIIAPSVELVKTFLSALDRDGAE